MKYQLRTVDVWDTLLRRHCAPDTVKLFIATHIWLNHFHRIHANSRDPWRIFRQRCNSEYQLAQLALQSGDDEYTHYDVLKQTLDHILDDKVDLEALLSSLIELEIQQEKYCSFPDPHIRQFLAKYPAIQTLFLSDFYMPASAISELLSHHKLDDVVATGTVSCDQLLNKRSGNLFRYIRRQYQNADGSYIHIGDNPHSDVAVPRDLGIRAVSYRPPKLTKRSNRLNALFCDRQRLINTLDKATRDTVLNSCSKTSKAFNDGLKLAPLFVGYCHYIAEQALIHKVKHICFFTREGEFFYKIFTALFPDNKYVGTLLPPASVIEVSRLSTFCASLREVSIAEFMRVWSLYSTQTMHAFAKTLDINPDLLNPILYAHGLDPFIPIRYPWRDDRVINLFQDPKFIALVDDKRHSARSQLLQYLETRGISSSLHSIAVVDIGWRGTIQDNLAYLFPNTIIHGIYLGLSKYLNSQPSNTQKSSFGPNLNQNPQYSTLLNFVSPIEMICNSPYGSTIGYQVDSNGIPTALRHINKNENRSFYTYSQDFQRGVLAAAAGWSEASLIHCLLASEMRPLALKRWKRLISSPSSALSRSYLALSHNEQFGVGGFVNQSGNFSLISLLTFPFDSAARESLRNLLYQTPSVYYVYYRQDLAMPHKLLLCLAIIISNVLLPLRHASSQIIRRLASKV